MSYDMTFTLKGVDPATREVIKLRDAWRQATQAKREYEQSGGGFGMPGGPGGSGNFYRGGRGSSGMSQGYIPGNYGPSGGTGGSGARQAGQGVGPFQRAAQDADNARRMRDAGVTGNQMADAEYRAKRSAQAAERAGRLGKGPTTQDAVMDFIMTSRFGLGGASPLVGRAFNIAKSAGFDAKASLASAVSDILPIASRLIPILAPLAAGAMFEGMASKFLPFTMARSNAFWSGGGSTAGLSGMGLNAEDIGSRGAAFGNALRGGGIGSAYFRSQGIVDQGIYTIDKSKNLERAVRLLDNIKSNTQAIQVARSTGLEDFLYRREANPALRNLADTSGFAPDASERAAAANYKISQNYRESRVQDDTSWLRKAAYIGGASFNIATGIVSDLMNPMKGWANISKQFHISQDMRNREYERKFGVGTSKGIDHNLDNLYPEGNPLHGTNSKNAKRSTDANTEALNQNTRALKDHAESIGLGPRGAGAVPKGWTYVQGQEALKGQSRMLGAFSL